MPRRYRTKVTPHRNGVIRRGPSARTQIVRFYMPSGRDAVAQTVDRVLEAVKPVGLRTGRRHDLAVAVSEALSNAALHGNRLAPGSRVAITVVVVPEKCAVVDVKDSGRGFDKSRVGDPTTPERLLAPAGRGVYLMHALVDEVQYNRKGNRVRLTMNRRKPQRRRR
jgi:serine/threonine-protein kinase RsbW